MFLLLLFIGYCQCWVREKKSSVIFQWHLSWVTSWPSHTLLSLSVLPCLFYWSAVPYWPTIKHHGRSNLRDCSGTQSKGTVSPSIMKGKSRQWSLEADGYIVSALMRIDKCIMHTVAQPLSPRLRSRIPAREWWDLQWAGLPTVHDIKINPHRHAQRPISQLILLRCCVADKQHSPSWPCFLSLVCTLFNRARPAGMWLGRNSLSSVISIEKLRSGKFVVAKEQLLVPRRLRYAD